ncbi:MAG: hypothetical protein ACE5EA_03245 [Nitrospirota bacterium]
MRPIIISVISLLSLIIINITPADAILMGLKDHEIQQAVSYGNFNAKTDDYEFLSEWIVNKGDYKGSAMLITEFLRIAYSARDAAIRAKEFTQHDINDAVAESRGRLVFSVSLYGSLPNFSKNLMAELRTPEKTIEVSFWTNSPAEPFGDGMDAPGYVADCEYWFSNKEIDPDSTVTLVVINPASGKQWEFPIDLSKMR